MTREVNLKQSFLKIKLIDKKSPKATLSLLGSVTSGNAHDFSVTYKDNKGIKAINLAIKENAI